MRIVLDSMAENIWAKAVRIIKIGVFVVVAVGSGSSPAFASELRVAVGEADYPPFYYQETRDGPYLGISMEVCQRIAKRLGHTLKFERYPFARLVSSLQIGSADMVCNFFNTPERAKIAIFADVPSAYESAQIFVKKGRSIHWDGGSLQQLSRYSFGGIRGYSFGQEYDTAQNLNKTNATDEKLQIKMLLADRFDIGIGSKAAILFHARQLGVQDQLVFLDPLLVDAPVFMAFSKLRPDAAQLAADFSRELDIFEKTPEYLALLQKYDMTMPKRRASR
jgi:polar amino acid transport system substrate-binding protein